MRDYHRLDMAIAIGIFTTLKANVNLHQAIGFRALYGANLVTYPADFRGMDTRVAHRVDSKARRRNHGYHETL